MNTLIYLIPIALVLGGLGLVAFLWAVRAANMKIWTVPPGASSMTAMVGRRADGSSIV